MATLSIPLRDGPVGRKIRPMRSVGFLVGALATVIALGVATPVAAVSQLLAATALIMGGTAHPLSTVEPPSFISSYLSNAEGFINAAPGQPTITKTVAVVTPQQFFPIYGLLTFDASVAEGKNLLHDAIETAPSEYRPDNDVVPAGVGNSLVVYGYSQSSVVASLEKRDLIQYYLDHPDETRPQDLSFVLVANPMRPNGGILERFVGLTIPLLEVTNFGATPTNSGDLGPGNDFPTVDITQQYDGWADFPVYPLDVVATANAIMGILLVHLDYRSAQMGTAVQQGTYGDTTYYMIPTETLPLLMPLKFLGVPSPIIKILDAPLRTLVEMGYDREVNPGEPIAAQWLRPGGDLMEDVKKLALSIPTGLDDGIEEVTGTRPFHTEPADMYGVHLEDTPAVKVMADTETPADPPVLATQIKVKKRASARPGRDATSAPGRQPTDAATSDRPTTRGDGHRTRKAGAAHAERSNNSDHGDSAGMG